MVESYLQRSFATLYKRIRGHDLPSGIPLHVISRVALTKIPSRVRGGIFSRVYNGAGDLHFRGRGVSTPNCSKYLTIGSNVIFGDRVVLSGFSETGIDIGNDVTVADSAQICASAVIREPGLGIRIGDRTSIGRNNTIWGQGGVDIGDDCLFGPGVTVVSENHIFDQRDVPIRVQGGTRRAIVIGSDCWIGANVVILAGTNLGHGSVVAAGAVVSGDVEPFSVIGGVPARKLRHR